MLTKCIFLLCLREEEQKQEAFRKIVFIKIIPYEFGMHKCHRTESMYIFKKCHFFDKLFNGLFICKFNLQNAFAYTSKVRFINTLKQLICSECVYSLFVNVLLAFVCCTMFIVNIFKWIWLEVTKMPPF